MQLIGVSPWALRLCEIVLSGILINLFSTTVSTFSEDTAYVWYCTFSF